MHTNHQSAPIGQRLELEFNHFVFLLQNEVNYFLGSSGIDWCVRFDYGGYNR